MIALLVAAAAMSHPEFVDGRCSYPRELGVPRPGESRVTCDSVVIVTNPSTGQLLVQFASKSGGAAPIGFAGPVSDDGTMTVRRIYRGRGVAKNATGGHCRSFSNAGGAMAGVSCVGTVGGQTFVANFQTAQ